MLSLEINRLLEKAISQSSHETYSRAIQAFHHFLRESGSISGSLLPRSVDEVAKFVAFLSLRGLAASTIATYLSGLAFYLKLNGMTDYTNNFLVRKLLRGVKLERKGNDSRLPITLSILTKVLSNLDMVAYSNFESCLFKASFSLAFFAFLRVGEITGGKPSRHALCINDVTFGTLEGLAGMFINLRSSKTDQLGQGKTLFLARAIGSPLCPVIMMEKYLAGRPLVPGQLFVHFDGSPVTRFQFSRVLNKAVSFIEGLPTNRFTSHSFRIGAATCAAMHGFSNEQIQEWGRWKSSCVKRYIRPPVADLSLSAYQQ